MFIVLYMYYICPTFLLLMSLKYQYCKRSW